MRQAVDLEHDVARRRLGIGRAEHVGHLDPCLRGWVEACADPPSCVDGPVVDPLERVALRRLGVPGPHGEPSPALDKAEAQ
jgi:hypothetical protein